MLQKFTFNPFQENTYLLISENKKAVVIDPGMSSPAENEQFDAYLMREGLELVACWLTHAHIDHVLGLNHIFTTFGLQPQVHPGEKPVYESNPQVAGMYGLPLATLPVPAYTLDGTSDLDHDGLLVRQLFAPGHSPASVCFYLPDHDLLIGGDVLFRDSIGRTDLPGGDHQTLLNSIQKKLYPLPKQTVVHPGHGPQTTIAYERVNNQFVRAER